MALTLKILSSGALTSSLTSIYPGDSPVPGKTALIKNIIITNKSTSAPATVNIAIRQQSNATDIYIAPFNLEIPARGQVVLDSELTLYLSTGPDRVRASASGGDVQYVINGFERDV